jgi:hypothetical protein
MTKLIVTFRNFANAPEISFFIGPKVFKLTLLLSSLQSLTLNHAPYIYKYSKVFQQYTNEVHKFLSEKYKTCPEIGLLLTLHTDLQSFVTHTAGKNKHYF